MRNRTLMLLMILSIGVGNRLTVGQTHGMKIANLGRTSANTQQSRQKEVAKIHSFGDVEKIVKYHFSKIDGFHDVGLINSKHLETLFPRLERAGWKVAERDRIVAKALPKGSFLDRELYSRKGKSFFNQIRKRPNVFENLDKISEMPHGKSSLHKLIHDIPNGAADAYKGLSTKNGKAWVHSLSKTRSGKHLKKSTGRIYDVPGLLAELKTSYDKARRTSSR